MEEEIVSGYEPVIEDMDCDADPEHCEEYLTNTEYDYEQENQNTISEINEDLADNVGTAPFIAASLAIIVVIIIVAILSRKKKQ